MNLFHRAQLEDQTTKALISRKLYLKNQDWIILVNFIKTKQELQKKSVKDYLKRIIGLLKREEVREKTEKGSLDDEDTENIKSTWGQNKDLMELDQVSMDKRKCFKCGKVDHIRRFCGKKILISLESENEKIPVKEEDRKKEESL